MITVHPDQAEPNFKHSRMTCRACVQFPLYADRIYASNNTQILKNPNDVLFNFADLDNETKPEIGTLKRDKWDISSKCCTESSKSKFLQSLNEVLFEMVRRAIKDIYLGGTTTTELQNEVATCRQMYYNKEN